MPLHPLFQNILRAHQVDVDSDGEGENAAVPTVSESGRSPAPLTLRKWNGLGPDEVGKYWEITGGEDRSTDYGGDFRRPGFSISGWIAEDQARFIVNAVNVHDELVAALRSLLSGRTLSNVTLMNDAYARARAALDKATGSP